MYPAIFNLIYYTLPDQEFQSDQINTIKKELLVSLKNRLNFELENDLFCATTTTYLNLNFKNFDFNKDTISRELHMERAKEYLESLTDIPRFNNLQKTCVEITFDDEIDK